MASNNNICFIVPAYNCENTIVETVESIFHNNFIDGDEIVIVNDCSTDLTSEILNMLKDKYNIIKIIEHTRNKGGAATRNTAVENAASNLIFCLDSDNILKPGSIQPLKELLLSEIADVASFGSLFYFMDDIRAVTHKWVYREGVITLEDSLAGFVFPGASGNYLYTKESWKKAGGYPEFAGALDTWGFGFRQLATGSKMIVLPDSFYYHRYGHESYWIRDSAQGKISTTAFQIILPFIDLINSEDIEYIMGVQGKLIWFDNMNVHPIKFKSGKIGKSGRVVNNTSLLNNIRNFIKKYVG
jgi:glycosyltransferase involved in cell wall biosynthesis